MILYIFTYSGVLSLLNLFFQAVHQRASEVSRDEEITFDLFFICSNLSNLKDRGVVECNLYVCFPLEKKKSLVNDVLHSIQRFFNILINLNNGEHPLCSMAFCSSAQTL